MALEKLSQKLDTVVNCCNGRVGKQPMEELITALGGS